RFYMCLQNIYFQNCIAFISPEWSTPYIVHTSEGQECTWISIENRTINSPTEFSVFTVDQSSSDALFSRSTLSSLEKSIPNATLPTLLTVSSTKSKSNLYTATPTDDLKLSGSNTVVIAVVICLVLIIIAVILATLFYKFRNETKPSNVLARVCFCFSRKSQQPPNNMEPSHQDVSPVNAKIVKIENVQNSKNLPNLSEEMPRNRVTQRYSAHTNIRVDNNQERADLDSEIMPKSRCLDLFSPEDKNMLESAVGYVNQNKVINEMAAEGYHKPLKRNTLEVHSEKLDNLGLSAIDNTLGLSAIDNTRSDYSKLHEIQKNVTNIYNTAHEQREPMKENFEKSKSFDQDTNLKCSSSDNIKYEIATTRDTILKSSSDISDIAQQDGLVKVLDQSNVAVDTQLHGDSLVPTKCFRSIVHIELLTMLTSSDVKLWLMLLLHLATVWSVDGLKSWTLRNVNLRETDPSVEVKTFYPDMPAIRILDEAMCATKQTTRVKLRVFPLEDVVSVVENDMDESTIRTLKSCLYPTTTNSSRCGVCWQDKCNSNISLPCKSFLGVSRWDSSLLVDITIDQGAIVNCLVMCREVGYYSDDVYKGGNGISMAGIGIIIAVVLVLGLIFMLSVYFVKVKCFKDLTEEDSPYPSKSKPNYPYPTKSQGHPFIKKDGGIIEF
ncbi:hypothetical protein Bpfe_011171, partial [Biomphalaria pfeifferi]